MTSRRIFITGPIFALLILAGTSPARSDGDDFFQGIDIPLMNQLIFVGNVKDQSGAYVSGALVTWHAVAQDADGEQQDVTAGTYSDFIGRYRTIDVQRIVSNRGLELDPAHIELTVTKPGYAMVRRFRHTISSQHMGLIEINFVLASSTANSK